MPGTDRRQNGPLATTLDTFVPRIVAAADAIDDARQLPPQLAAAMADAGLFRLLLPFDLEGSDTPYPAYLRAVQTIRPGRREHGLVRESGLRVRNAGAGVI